jgi:ABC-2 type transport system ATP-binding protein
MSAVVKARHLSKRYGKRLVLDDVSFDIGPGRVVGLIGANGSGKTTTLKALLGLAHVDGELEVLGKDPFRQREALMEEVSFIADVAVLPRWLKVSDAVDFVAGVHPRFDRKRAAMLLARTKLEPKMKVKQMSKGMIVQLHLALILAIDSRLLVLDEPTLGLDLLFRQQFYETLLNDYYDGERTIIVTTHEVTEIEHVLTDLMFMRDGQLVLNTPMETLGERFTEVLVAPDRMLAAQALRPVHQRELFGQSVLLFDGVARQMLSPLGEMRTPSLHDLFLATMKETRV